MPPVYAKYGNKNDFSGVELGDSIVATVFIARVQSAIAPSVSGRSYAVPADRWYSVQRAAATVKSSAAA